MADQHAYFVKVRGRTLGPFNSSRMCQMIQQGHISRINHVSIDGNTWQTASEFPQLFQLTEQVQETSSGTKHSTDSPSKTSSQIPGDPPKDLDAENGQVPVLAQWYFGGANKPVGPVNSFAIQELIRQGKLTPQEVVWRNGMSGWATISQVPDFAQALPLAVITMGASKFCFACASKIDHRAEICPTCGVRQHGATPTTDGGIAWTSAEMTVFILLTLLIPLIGIVVGFIGLTQDCKRSQGGVLLAVSIAMIFVFLSLL